MARRARLSSTFVLVIFFSLLPPEAGFGQEKPGLLIPLGRLVQNGNVVSLAIDGAAHRPSPREDGCGGFWSKIPLDALRGKSRVTVTVVKTAAGTRWPGCGTGYTPVTN